jgi:hypothetical protein
MSFHDGTLLSATLANDMAVLTLEKLGRKTAYDVVVIMSNEEGGLVGIWV